VNQQRMLTNNIQYKVWVTAAKEHAINGSQNKGTTQGIQIFTWR